MLNKSKDHNSNYLAKIVRLPPPRKHENADRLLCWNIDFQNIITDLTYNSGDVVICFPLECTINKSLTSFIDGFENKELNNNKEVKGYFNKHARVRAVKLRGEYSQGFVLPINVVGDWLISEGFKACPITGIFKEDDINDLIGKEFDSYENLLICEKYVPKNLHVGLGKGNRDFVKRMSRLVDNQFRLHNDTSNLRRNIGNLSPNDIIGIHYKKHGTSWVVGNVLTKRKISWIEKLLIKFGVNIETQIYDYIYSSRRVIKNQYENLSLGYYKTDIWGDIKDQIKECIPKGYTLYGEYLGFTKDNSPIQGGYDYGCNIGEGKIYVYRITITNPDGFSIELDDLQIKDFCNQYGLNYSDTFFYYGKVKDMYPIDVKEETWRDEFIAALELQYNGKNCYMCKNVVPEEGIVIRKQNTFTYEAYKLKNKDFLEWETKQLDKEIIDIESLEEVI